MGATDVIYFFNDFDAERGIKRLKAIADREHGGNRDYSGEINSIDMFRKHYPSADFKNEADLKKYINERLSTLGSRCAEYFPLTQEGYMILTPVIQECDGIIHFNPSDLNRADSPAIIVSVHGRFMGEGTVEELKERGKELVWSSRFTESFFIISKRAKASLIVTGNEKFVKTTSRRSQSTTMVNPCYKFVVYGWAAT